MSEESDTTLHSRTLRALSEAWRPRRSFQALSPPRPAPRLPWAPDTPLAPEASERAEGKHRQVRAPAR